MPKDSRRHEGRKALQYRPYVATVEGLESGVPFRVFFKRLECAEHVAQKTGGTLQDLFTLARRRWVAGEWREE